MIVNAEEEQEQRQNAESRMRALHRATLTLFSDLSLDGVLRRIIHAARELVDARYAALGIPDDRGGLEQSFPDYLFGISENRRHSRHNAIRLDVPFQQVDGVWVHVYSIHVNILVPLSDQN